MNRVTTVLPSRRTAGLYQTVFSESTVDVHHIIRQLDWCVQFNLGDKIEQNKMGGLRCTHGCIEGFGVET